ncbi:MAG: hypothetical protein ACM34A_12055 [Bacillota bacterium]
MAAILTPTFQDKRMDDAFTSIFGASKFHSEQDRQEAIGKKADAIAKEITAALMTDESEATEIASDMLGFMEPETLVHIMRCALRGDLPGANIARQLLLSEMDSSIKRTAEHRAIKQVESEGQQ